MSLQPQVHSATPSSRLSRLNPCSFLEMRGCGGREATGWGRTSSLLSLYPQDLPRPSSLPPPSYPSLCFSAYLHLSLSLCVSLCLCLLSLPLSNSPPPLISISLSVFHCPSLSLSLFLAVSVLQLFLSLFNLSLLISLSLFLTFTVSPSL